MHNSASYARPRCAWPCMMLLQGMRAARMPRARRRVGPAAAAHLQLLLTCSCCPPAAAAHLQLLQVSPVMASGRQQRQFSLSVLRKQGACNSLADDETCHSANEDKAPAVHLQAPCALKSTSPLKMTG
mmetsp:Transcript_15020/g.44222  ORF Transcript_15020/g.44222 Transcript_15020/m.44222 type:complete len:128 (+) Transcript_15020:191-574(+)